MEPVAGQTWLSLRDYLAAKAMQGFIACPNTKGEIDDIAKWCFKMADAMLKARNGTDI